MKDQRALDTGFSLLELVAVLSIFALVALIGVQVLQASVKTSERLTAVSDASADLAKGLALLRHDLNAAFPSQFEPPNGAVDPALKTNRSSFDLSVAGLSRIDPGATGFGRIRWRFDRTSKQVFRQVWTSLNPADARATEVLVFDEVDDFELSSFSMQAGWRVGYAVDPRNPGQLPLGLKVALSVPQGDDIEIIVSLR